METRCQFLELLVDLFKHPHEFNEWTTSFHMILIGTANSKSLDSKKLKVVEAKKAGDKPKPPFTTCTMCGRFYHEKSACPETSNKYANRTNSPYIGSDGHPMTTSHVISTVVTTTDIIINILMTRIITIVIRKHVVVSITPRISMVVIVRILSYVIVSSSLVARVIIPVAMRVVIHFSTVVVTVSRTMATSPIIV